MALAALVGSGCNFIIRVSLDPAGGPATTTTSEPDLSPNGRFVVFVSEFANSTDTFGGAIFERDLRTGTTTQVSVNFGGGAANALSFSPSVSADGRFVAFTSNASNLVVGGGPGPFNRAGLFVRDMAAGATSQLIAPQHEDDINSRSRAYSPTISDDGSFVIAGVSSSEAGSVDLFDRATGAIIGGAGSDFDFADDPALSADGRRFAYERSDGTRQVIVSDVPSGNQIVASVSTTGGAANGPSFRPSFSGSSRFVVFESQASNLVPGDTNGEQDVFIRDLQTNTTTRVSVDQAGGDANGFTTGGSVSGDGRYVMFQSLASDLVPGDTNGAMDVFVRDMRTGRTTRVDTDALGRQVSADPTVFRPGASSISRDGHYVAFASNAPELTGRPAGGPADVFVRYVQEPTVASVSPATLAPGATATLTVNGTNFFAGATAATSGGGVTVNSVTLVSETKLQVSVTVAADAAPGARSVTVSNAGTGPGVMAAGTGLCFNCLTIS